MAREFEKKKLIKDVSANTLQTIITQVFGILIFYITSKYLTKDNFGEFNWSLAVGSTIIAVASLGLDLVFVKRVASGEDVLTIGGIHFFHTLAAGFVLSLAAFAVQLFVPAFSISHPLFFFIFLNLTIANIANSFKLCLNGLESYRALAILALCSNVFKFLMIVFFYCTGRFTIANVIFGYMATSVLELVFGYYLMSRSISTRIKPLLKITEYKYFILESLPQLGVVLFDSALARIDWILLGIISTAAATAEYSFAYKIFELSKLPLLIIAPLLLTRFSKLFGNGGVLSETHKNEIRLFFQLELFVLMLIPIILICTWTPLIDYFTDNKYGAVNELNFKILAACVPLAGIINFLWTVGFIQGQLKTIMFITIAVSITNVAANALLIPFYGNTGAAIAFLACTVLQVSLYMLYIKQPQVKPGLKNCVLMLVNAGLAIALGKFTTNNIIFTTVTALFTFVVLTLITGQLKLKQLRQTFIKRA
jgi:O-antigen/teichoic acid export membrane protein